MRFSAGILLSFTFLAFGAGCLPAQVDPPPGIPRVVTVCDKVQQFEACADWTWNGKDFSYKYAKTSGTGTITRNGQSEVIMRRTDNKASWPFKRGEADYMGTFDTNHSGYGRSIYRPEGGPPLPGTWTATFAPVKPAEATVAEPALPPPPPPGTALLVVPPGFEECEGSCMTLHDRTAGAWLFRGNKGYAQWPRGSKATLMVQRYDANGVIIRREDTTDSTVAGRVATYYGTVHGDRLEGTEIAVTMRGDGTMEQKAIPWFATIPVTICNAGVSAEEALETGGKAAAFRQMPNAFQCFLIAAKQGNGRAKSLVGVMYRDGMGVETNYKEASVWLKAAAVQGDYYAQLAMEQIYEIGLGISPDAKQAQVWKHVAETNPAYLHQEQVHQDQKEMNQLMVIGISNIFASMAHGALCCL